ncbi:hypothetical protein FGG08_006004 [Glutinoglossum americanum]|uniref:Tyrosinase C-terminal domain-containing protein n=1 Tax=Glutinoglossum americanum TaxID=1670608 RepID=A0A9P8HTG7_9PEZI|nr:hypothetical protein FGG08_006004 [Glutinoglossum americanum]
MQLPSSTTHLEYDLSILCGPYPQPFFVHIFLGDVPHNIDYNLPVDHPSWVAQQYITPHSPDQLAAYSSTIAQSNPQSNINDGPPPQHHHHLPFLKNAITASICLTPHILARLHLSSPTELNPSTIPAYLHENLHWTLSSVSPVRKELDVKGVPIRLWVVESEVTPLPEGRWGPPTVGRSETLWEATRGKEGGLRKGEMPEGEA